MRRRKRKEGFTLVELLIVLAIISSLVSVVTPTAINAIRKAKATQVGVNMRNLNIAVMQYVTLNSTIPSTISDLVPGYVSRWPGSEYTIETVTATKITICYDAVASGADPILIRQVYPALEASGSKLCFTVTLFGP